MAREQITHNHITPPPAQTPDDQGVPDPVTALISVETQRRNVHVQWNRVGTQDAAGLETGWLQLGIDITVAEIRDLLQYAEEEAARAAAANAHIGEYATEHHPVRVWSDVLSRPEVNKAITALRRGRDVAYGRDA